MLARSLGDSTRPTHTLNSGAMVNFTTASSTLIVSPSFSVLKKPLMYLFSEPPRKIRALSRLKSDE